MDTALKIEGIKEDRILVFTMQFRSGREKAASKEAASDFITGRTGPL